MRIRRIAANDFKQLQSIELNLPPVGRFLVKGRNEAGKSTLFEALFFGLFGKSLVGRNLDEAIGYAREKAWVEVWIETHAGLFKIQRTLTRGKPQQAMLLVERDGQVVEQVSGAQKVSSTIAEYLKLDGDALLNTCFVEQKKLDKLEGADRDKREASLSKLLNLEKLKAIEDSCKIVGDDRLRETRAQQRLDLARLGEQLPTAEARRTALEESRVLVRAQAALERVLAEQAEVDRREAEIDALDERLAALSAQHQEIERVKAAGVALNALCDAVAKVDDTRQQRDRLGEDIRQRRHEVAGLAAAEAQARRLRRLVTRVERLDRVARRHDGLQAQASEREREAGEMRARRADLQGEEARLVTVDAGLATAEQALAEAEQATQASREYGALTEWRDAFLTAAAPERAAVELDDLRREREATRVEVEAMGLSLAAGGVAAAQHLREVFERVEAVAYRIGYLEGSQETLRQRAQADQKRLSGATRRLAELGAATPPDEVGAEARLQALAAVLAGRDERTLQGAANVARDALAAQRGRRGELARKVGDLTTALAGRDEAEIQRLAVAARAQADKAQAIEARWRPRVQAALVSAGVSANELARTCTDAEVLVRHLRSQAEGLPRLERDRAEIETRLVTAEMAVPRAYEEAERVIPDLPALTPRLRLADLQARLDQLRAGFRSMQAGAVQAELAERRDALGRAREARDQATRRSAEAFTEGRDLLRQQRLADRLPDARHATVQAARDELAAFGLNARALEDEYTALVGEIRSLRDRRDRLQTDLGISDEELDVDRCEAELAALRRDHAVRDRARRMVEQARKRIVAKIMPNTMDHMAVILPDLTAGRYKAAELAEDFRIRVWDERAGDGGEWKQKDIFSGGARDQLSLALRLSFALATLPAERGAAPSFIFLDEPLGAFDDERADALLALLTAGQIGRSFDQVFLISHVRVDENAFTYRIVMDGGRVAEHNLPNTGSPVSQAQPALASP